MTQSTELSRERESQKSTNGVRDAGKQPKEPGKKERRDN